MFTGVGVGMSTMNTAEVTAIVVTVVVLGLIGYPIVWEAATRGRSPGKLALGLRVVGDDDSPERDENKNAQIENNEPTTYGGAPASSWQGRSERRVLRTQARENAASDPLARIRDGGFA